MRTQASDKDRRKKSFPVRHYLSWGSLPCAALLLKNHTVLLDIFLEPYEYICKDSIKLSIDSKKSSIDRWSVSIEQEEEYVVPLKAHKKVYKVPFEIEILLKDEIFDCTLFFSCFLVKNNECIEPTLKQVLLPKAKNRRKTFRPA